MTGPQSVKMNVFLFAAPNVAFVCNCSKRKNIFRDTYQIVWHYSSKLRK